VESFSLTVLAGREGMKKKEQGEEEGEKRGRR